MFLPTALSRTFHRLDDTVRRRGVWTLYRKLVETERWPKDRIRTFQLEKLRALLRHAAAHSPYYRDVLAGVGADAREIRTLGDLAALPLLTREIVRERGEDIRSRGIPARSLLPNSTGGSTGSNVRFWVDADCWRWRDATSLHMWDVMGLRAGMPTVLIWGSPMDERPAKRLRGRVRMFLDNKRFVSAYRIGDEEIEQIVAYIGRVRPRILHGYPSVLDMLATQVRRRRLAWPELPGLTVVSASESLYPEQRENIATTFAARVLNLYGCREVGLIAVECPAGSLHIQEERLIVELLPSTDGGHRVVITDLDNRGFPFVRYEIGDLAEPETAPCSCGRAHARLGSIGGRTFDVIRGPDGRAVGGTFWSLLLRTAAPSVETWQVVQSAPDLVEIRVTPREAVTSAAEQERIRDEVRSVLGREMRVEFRREARLDPLPSGKHRFVVGLAAERETQRSRR
jgi:phenylacetate-CoA ligase